MVIYLLAVVKRIAIIRLFAIKNKLNVADVIWALTQFSGNILIEIDCITSAA